MIFYEFHMTGFPRLFLVLARSFDLVLVLISQHCEIHAAENLKSASSDSSAFQHGVKG